MRASAINASNTYGRSHGSSTKSITSDVARTRATAVPNDIARRQAILISPTEAIPM